MNRPKNTEIRLIRESFTVARATPGENTLTIHGFVEGAGPSDRTVVNYQGTVVWLHSGGRVRPSSGAVVPGHYHDCMYLLNSHAILFTKWTYLH